MDQMILPSDLKMELQPVSFLSKIGNWFKKIFWKVTKSKKALIVRGIKPVGAPSYDPIEGRMVTEEQNPDAYMSFVKPRGEVIEPVLGDTPESIAERISQAACDREFARIIVYPVVGPIRKEVLDLVSNDPKKFPLYEYRSANIVNDDNLDARTIIYKHAGPSHASKPI